MVEPVTGRASVQMTENGHQFEVEFSVVENPRTHKQNIFLTFTPQQKPDDELVQVDPPPWKKLFIHLNGRLEGIGFKMMEDEVEVWPDDHATVSFARATPERSVSRLMQFMHDEVKNYQNQSATVTLSDMVFAGAETPDELLSKAAQRRASDILFSEGVPEGSLRDVTHSESGQPRKTERD